jgi:hypothetical protein
MNDHDDRNQKDDELTEEELRQLLEDARKVHHLKAGYDIGFILHRNFGYHILFTLIINLLVGGIIVGITSRFYPLIGVTWPGLVLGLVLYTLMELIIKILLIRFLLKPIIYSFGLIFYVLNVVLFWITDVIVDGFDFKLKIENIFIFTIFFMLLRLLFSTYVRKAAWIQKGLK